MSLLIGIYAIAGLIWFAAWWRQGWVVPGSWLLWGTSSLIAVEALCGYQVFSLQAGPLPLTCERMALAGLAVAALLGLLRTRGESWRWDGLDGIVLLWFVVLAGSTLLTDYQFRNNTPLSRLLFLNAMPLAAYAIVKHSGWQLTHLRILACGAGLFGIYLAMTAVAEWQQWYALVFPKFILSTTEVQEFFGRGRGPLLNPIINGMLMSAAAALFLVAWPTQRWRGRTCLSIGLVVLGLGMIATLTRSVWLGLIASGGIVILSQVAPARRWWLIAFAVLVAMPAAFVAKETLARFKRDQNVSVEDMAQSASLRPMFARIAWEMFQDRPITGVGFGQYQKYKRPYHHIHDTQMPLQRALPYFQHNVFLAYLVEMGLIGLCAIMALLGGLFYTAWRLAADEFAPVSARQLAAVALAIGTSYVVNGMFHDVSLIPVANFHVLLALGLVGRARHLVAESAVGFNGAEAAIVDWGETRFELQPTAT